MRSVVGVSAEFLNPSEAARRLGVSAKALRLYEQRGLISPVRTAAGWRAYGPDEMRQASEIAALRTLGFSLAQVARVLKGDLQGLEPALTAHQAALEGRIRDLITTVGKVRDLRDGLGRGLTPSAGELARALAPAAHPLVAFDLPWPWGGERFELRHIHPLTYITGPLGSGKTRLARCLAEAIPDATFLGLERLTDDGEAARAQLDADPTLKSRVDRLLAWLIEDGATVTNALTTLLVGMEADGSSVLVVDMIETGLDKGTQEALIAQLRRRASGARPLLLLTRSNAILDLDSVAADEAIIFCPANHAAPYRVAPYRGAPGFEALASCLASPEVRARTEGVIAWRPAAPVATAGIPFVSSASYPVRAGNSVRPLIDGEPAFRRICEAIEAARQSVWVTVTFMWAAFEMPDGQGSALDVLDRAAARGVDVRIIFWRPDEDQERHRRNAFWGSSSHRAMLDASRSGVKIRWDRAHAGFCQHQKSWLIDTSTEDASAVVGGINLNPHSMVAPGHDGEGHNHDVYVELAGPSVIDVHHNFVQRWNEASERLADDGRWGAGSEADLEFPTRVPAVRGSAAVQIQRTIHRGCYADRRAPPEGMPFDIAAGETSNFDQYCTAINAARHSIYIENQYIDVPEIVDRLRQALRRGVDIVLLMPAEPDVGLQIPPERRAILKARAELGTYESFMLAGIAGKGADGRRKSVYVHAKLMLIDDEWATVGSCNLHRYSLFGNSEMNVAFAEPNTVRALRCELLREHLDRDTSGMGDRDALHLFRKIAKENRRRFDVGDHDWQGLAFELDPATYPG